MPVGAAAAGIGAGIGAIGSALNQSAANKGPQALFPGLQQQTTSGLATTAAPAFTNLLSLIKTGNPVDTTQLSSSLTQQHNLQQTQALAQIKEQFGASGLGASSPAAVGTSNFLSQDNASFLSMLAQLQYQSASDAASRQTQATEFGLSSLFGPGLTDTGPKGSVLGAALTGSTSGAASGIQTGNSIQMLALLNALQQSAPGTSGSNILVNPSGGSTSNILGGGGLDALDT